MDIGICNSYLVVDIRTIRENITKIRSQIGPDCSIMPVIKGNAYGLGLTEVANYLVNKCGIKIIAISQVSEALQLRKARIGSELFVMGGVPYHNVKEAIEQDIQMPVFTTEFAAMVNDEAKKQNKIANLHIKIETGLNRIGVKPGEKLKELVDYLSVLDNINIKGVYSHFSESEVEDKSHSHLQLDRFKEALKQLEILGIKPDYIHICNSAAAVWFKDAYYNLIRPAGLIFGYDSNVDIKNRLGLETPITWKSFITNIKEVEKDEDVGYNRGFTADRKMKVATLSFGFGDGYIRSLAFKGAYVLLRGKKAPIIGICMDQSFVDISEIEDAAINDEVTLVGKDGDEEIDVLDLANLIGHPYVYPLCMIGQRVKRLYIE